MWNFHIFVSFPFKFVNEVTENDDDKHFYQNIPLARYNSAVRNVKAHYTATIANVTCMENRFESLQASALFKHLIALLDVTSWLSANIESFGDAQVSEMAGEFQDLLVNAGCKTENIMTEWMALKTFVVPIIANNK